MAHPKRPVEPGNDGHENEAPTREVGKQRIPASPIEQRPGLDEPVGNGGTNEPAAFPPHN